MGKAPRSRKQAQEEEAVGTGVVGGSVSHSPSTKVDLQDVDACALVRSRGWGISSKGYVDHRTAKDILRELRGMGVSETYSDELILSIVDDLRFQQNTGTPRNLSHISTVEYKKIEAKLKNLKRLEAQSK